MGTGKKEASRRERQGKSNDGMGNVRTKGENFYRDAKKVKTLNMFKDGKAQRNASGKITKAASYQSRDKPSARIEPNRKWFGNTRVISQEALSSFREAVAEKAADPYQVLLKTNKLPMSLIQDGHAPNGLKQHKAKIAVENAPFSDTFGPKAQRKRVKLSVDTLEGLAGETVKMHDSYLDRLEQAKLLSGTSGDANADANGADAELTAAREPIFSKGQSKRIWNELYKVIDSSDVIVHALDARDPEGTRCRSVEKYIQEEAPHKHLIFVLNKCDLVPTGVAAAWVRALSKEYPTLAFHASINNSFGKGSLIQLLRQFSILHSDRKQISVGFIGYPNTGKSSIINTLRKKKVCTVAPIPGETKVWQYITLMKRIYLIDCPGVVPPSNNATEEDILLRGVVRVENVENPEQYIPAILKKTQQRHIERTYEIKGFTDATEFLSILARKGGRLLKGGEPDVNSVAKMVINDFLRGKLPWYTPPPKADDAGDEKINGREGRLGEMGLKRKADEAQGDGGDEVQSGPDASDDDVESVKSETQENGSDGNEDESEFEGFEDSDNEDGGAPIDTDPSR
ncbi:nucleolar GTP-binding protein [Trichophyton tonsurans CBS 112818]|uniref:Nucleolar GTP-binding protein 2 n=2 Tax=Trichophyton TaxID=5550 RepID=F2PI15_TRIEC|nr:nucleolar GTP-binding protein [Trichophyton tonsurans CBS 112818]EGE01577.1 nucleolar GTP-binding protein 2 [Trichophyton equinum CBS 127.97]